VSLVLPGPDARLLTVSSPAPQGFAPSSVLNWVRIWDGRTGDLLNRPLQVPGIGPSFHVAGERFLAAWTEGDSLKVVDALSGQPGAPPLTVTQAAHGMKAFSPDGRHLLLLEMTGGNPAAPGGLPDMPTPTGSQARLVELESGRNRVLHSQQLG